MTLVGAISHPDVAGPNTGPPNASTIFTAGVNLVLVGRCRAKFGPSWAEHGGISSIAAQRRPESAQILPMPGRFGRCGSIVPALGRKWPGFGRVGPSSGTHRPASQELARASFRYAHGARASHRRSTRGAARSELGRCPDLAVRDFAVPSRSGGSRITRFPAMSTDGRHGGDRAPAAWFCSAYAFLDSACRSVGELHVGAMTVAPLCCPSSIRGRGLPPYVAVRPGCRTPSPQSLPRETGGSCRVT